MKGFIYYLLISETDKTGIVAKPPWNDEFATVVFSLGNSFRTVPINQAIALDVLGSAKEVMMHCNDE